MSVQIFVEKSVDNLNFFRKMEYLFSRLTFHKNLLKLSPELNLNTYLCNSSDDMMYKICRFKENISTRGSRPVG
jgi:hypothetical protein